MRRSMLVIGLAGGFTVLGAGIAASNATADELAPAIGVAGVEQTSATDEDDQTSGEDGIGSGNQAEADVEAPVDATDNQVTVIGDGNQSEGAGSGPENGVEPDADVDHTSGEEGTLSGNQVEAEAEAPVELSGNQVTVIGDGNTSEGSSSGTCQDDGASSGDTTNGDEGLLSGNQVDADVDAPVDVSGNQVTVIGDENTSGGTGGAGCGSASGTGGSGGSGEDAGPVGSGDTTSGEDGVGSGNQGELDPDVPVDAAGNQVTVIGDGNQSGGATGGDGAAGDSQSDGSPAGGDTTSGEGGALAGNQLELEPDVPVDARGNQVTVIGDQNQSGGSTDAVGSGGEGGAGDSQNGGSPAGGDTTSGDDGTGSGNQLSLAPGAPVDASGNQVTVIGDQNQSGGATGGEDEGDAGDSEDGETTSGEGGTGSGNQLTLDPVARLGADDNQLTVLGDGNESDAPGDSGGNDGGDGDDSTGGSGDPDGDGEDGTGGSGDPDGGGDSDGPRDGGHRDDGEVRGAGSGGPGRPGVVALGALPTDAGPAAGTLPQTGAGHGQGIGLLGLMLLLAGLVLTTLRRREVSAT